MLTGATKWMTGGHRGSKGNKASYDVEIQIDYQYHIGPYGGGLIIRY